LEFLEYLYPAIEPNQTDYLKVGNIHSIYWEECGNPAGIPVVFLHGGPGTGCSELHRRFFDPKKYRIILFDQRGCGRSLPIGELTENTTQFLIQDIESLRVELNIDKWVVFGGSWGSTLALAYAEARPKRCLELVLRGIFLGTNEEINWFMEGIGHFFPENGEQFRSHLPVGEQKSLLKSYYKRLTDPDPKIHSEAALRWYNYESMSSSLLPELGEKIPTPQIIACARLEAHYFMNNCFLQPSQLINDLKRIQNIPCTIVHGRYDIICPPKYAELLASHYPKAKLHIIEKSGHSAFDPAITKKLVDCMDIAE
jgi:proline iminopeptidase